ncbi:putative signal recognition particle protein [Cercophora newfieldiana]|uniref:Signal recognition particle subunit SRP72 n=1 Tax=Cercophora newfieldiana TaxID=92897 RepID=A0AA39YHC3_9PEZI|nr:putative signal recognition particle protein [Cercophora newfieldiana]
MADPAIAALNSLLRRTTIEDHTEAFKLANSAIKTAKANSDDLITAQHTRVVALLKLDRFEDALRALSEGGDALQKQCVLEKSYALYKTGELDAAEELLQSAGAGRGMKHVAAQVAYRNEKFEKAAAIYRDLAGEEAGKEYGEENDLRINFSATNAQLEWQGKGGVVPDTQKQPGREDLEAFETSYNAACGCISRGDFAKAAMLLKRSRDLCEATEDLDDEEKKAELVPIIVQQAYVFTRLGKLDEATSLYKSLDLDNVSDGSTKLIAQANSLFLETGENPFLTQRIFESLPVASGNDKLFGYQSSTLRHDKFVIHLKAQKYPGVEEATTTILDEEAASPVAAATSDLGVLNAAAACQLQTGKEALRKILPLLESRPDDLGLLLTIIQLYIQLKSPGPALNLLEAFFKRLEAATTADHADVRFAPGLIALAVALYRQQGQQSAIRKELAKAAAHWQRRGSSQSAAAGGNTLIRGAGIELLRSVHPSDLAAAGDAFSYLVSTQTGDRTATAGLVASFATSDFAKVQPHLNSLPPVEKVIGGVDVDALIDAGVAVLPTAEPSPGKKRSLDETGAARQQPAKKARKRKLPKNYDPNKKPDPERWLPLRDRSSYKPKGKKGKKRAAEATQGGVVHEETLELAGGAGSVKVEKAPASGGGGGGKKKKKGKK